MFARKKSRGNRSRELFRFHSVPRSHTGHGRLHAPLHPAIRGPGVTHDRGHRERCARAAHQVLSKTGFRGNVCEWTVRALQDEQWQGVAGPATGPSVLSLPLPPSLFLSPWSVNGGAKRGAMTGIPLLAQTEGPTRWPRGIRKLAKPDLLVSFTCLTRAPATPVPFSRSSSFILLRVGIERRCIARRATSTGSRLTCITHLPAYTHVHVLFVWAVFSWPPYFSVYAWLYACARKTDHYRPGENWTPLLHSTFMRITTHEKKMY